VTTVLARAYAAIPNFTELSAAIDRLRDHATILASPTVPTADQVADEVRAVVVAGQPIPDNIGARVVAAEDDQRHRQAEAALIGFQAGSQRTGVVGRLAHERDALIRQHADDVLKFLSAELDQIIDQVADADRALGGVRTAEQAVRAGAEQSATWSQLSDLVTDYDALRAAQQQVLVLAGGEVARVCADLEAGGYVKNSITIDPYWTCRIAGELETTPDAEIVARSPWPSPRLTRGSAHWPTTDKPSYIRWLATGPAQAWVPTRPALRRALERLATAEREAAAERARPSGPSEERALITAGIASRARFRH
jgi:hypothetical protein